MILQGTSLVLGETFIDEGKATKLGRDGQSTINALRCEQHEEADTRMFADAAYAAANYEQSCIVVHATNTDIIILGMYHVCQLPPVTELWMQKQDSCLPVHELLLLQ